MTEQPRQADSAQDLPAMVSWQALRDADNPENRAAGNRSDWLKHTIWLSGLSALCELTGQAAAKSSPMQLHSCHAGRGMYRIPADTRREPLERLWQSTDEPLLLQRAQHAICQALGVNRDAVAWYAGSALLCQWWRCTQQPSWPSTHQLYEWDPETRAVLSATLAQLYPELADSTLVVAQDTHGGGRFDGESYIAQALPHWPAHSILLLDPFALWRHPKHSERRQRFLRIFEALRDRGENAPAASLFFAWGSGTSATQPGALANRSPHYRQLRQLARKSAHALMEIHWQWDLHCSMWWLLPQREPQLAERVAERVAKQISTLIERFASVPSHGRSAHEPTSGGPALRHPAPQHPVQWSWTLCAGAGGHPTKLD